MITLSVTGQRAAVVRPATRRLLDELRRFRHFSRYYFDLEYDAAKIEFLHNVLDRLGPMLDEDLNEFLDFLGRLDQSDYGNGRGNGTGTGNGNE